MIPDRRRDHWQTLRGRIKEEWGKLTDEEPDQPEGKMDRLAGKISVKYGLAKEEAYRELKALEGEEAKSAAPGRSAM